MIPGAANAQQSGVGAAVEGLIGCSRDPNPETRLGCFDALSKTLSGESEGNADPQTFEGRDRQELRIAVDRPWRARWTTRSHTFSIELVTGQGESLGVIGHQFGNGSGQSKLHPGGRYMLRIEAIGEWTVEVAPAR